MAKQFPYPNGPLRNAKERFDADYKASLHGLLIVNPFLQNERFNSIYESLQQAFLNQGIVLHIATYADLVTPLGESIEAPRDIKFALFWDKDISFARQLEMEGIPVFNSSKGIENADSKIKTALLLQEANISTPKTILGPLTFPQCGYNDFSFLRRIEEALPYPYILKEEFGSFGEQVYLIHNEEEAKERIKALGAKRFLVQEFIQEASGTDLRVVVIGDKVVCAYKRVSGGDFRSNLALGGHSEKVEIDEATASIAIKATKALGLDFAGVDILLSNRGPLVCEVNSNPQFLGAKKATGVDVAEALSIRIFKSLGR